MLFCSSTEANAWTSGPGRTVLGVFVLQAAVNQARAPAGGLMRGWPFGVVDGLALWAGSVGVSFLKAALNQARPPAGG